MKHSTERCESLPAEPPCKQGLLAWAQHHPNAALSLPALKWRSCIVQHYFFKLFFTGTTAQNNASLESAVLC